MTSMSSSLKACYTAAMLILLNAVSPAVLAMNKPTDTNSFGHPIYDFFVNKVVHGPPGFVAIMFVIVSSAAHITKNWMLSALGMISGTALIYSDQIVVSMGALV